MPTIEDRREAGKQADLLIARKALMLYRTSDE
jgi:hypothetical protein